MADFSPFREADYSFDKNDANFKLGDLIRYVSGGFGVVVKLPTKTVPRPGYICRRHTEKEIMAIRDEVLASVIERKEVNADQ